MQMFIIVFLVFVGSVSANCGNRCGNRRENQCGNRIGNEYGYRSGNECGNRIGNEYGYRRGNECGNRCGNECGNRIGNEYGYRRGNECGNRCGNECGNQCVNECGNECGNQCGNLNENQNLIDLKNRINDDSFIDCYIKQRCSNDTNIAQTLGDCNCFIRTKDLKDVGDVLCLQLSCNNKKCAIQEIYAELCCLDEKEKREKAREMLAVFYPYYKPCCSGIHDACECKRRQNVLDCTVNAVENLLKSGLCPLAQTSASSQPGNEMNESPTENKMVEKQTTIQAQSTQTQTSTVQQQSVSQQTMTESKQPSSKR